MRVLPAAGGTIGCPAPVEELAWRVRASGAGAPSLNATGLGLSGAAVAGEGR